MNNHFGLGRLAVLSSHANDLARSNRAKPFSSDLNGDSQMSPVKPTRETECPEDSAKATSDDYQRSDRSIPNNSDCTRRRTARSAMPSRRRIGNEESLAAGKTKLTQGTAAHFLVPSEIVSSGNVSSLSSIKVGNSHTLAFPLEMGLMMIDDVKVVVGSYLQVATSESEGMSWMNFEASCLSNQK